MPLDESVMSAFANVAASQTDAAIITGVTGRKMRVLGVVIVNGDTAGSSVTFNTKPSGAGTAISATFKSGANGTVVLPEGSGWFTTNVAEGLSVTTGAGATTAVGIQVSYIPIST